VSRGGPRLRHESGRALDKLSDQPVMFSRPADDGSSRFGAVQGGSHLFIESERGV
jgi:hypothetical protein